MLSAAVAAAAGCLGGSDEGETDDSDASDSDDSGDRADQSPIEMEVVEYTLADEVVVSETSSHEVPADEVFLIIKVTAENTSDAVLNLPSVSEFAAVFNGTQTDAIFSPSVWGDPETISEPVSDDLYEGVSDARPGVSASGWLVFQIPRDVSDVQLSFSRRDLHTELPVGAAPDELPHFAVTNIDVPETTHLPTIDIRVTVVNHGGASGMWTEEVSVAAPAYYTSEAELTAEIDAGDEMNVSQAVDVRELGEHQITVAGESLTTKVEKPELMIGDVFSAEGVAEIAATDRYIASELRWEYGLIDEVHEPDNGNAYLIQRMDLKNSTEESVVAPKWSDITLLVNGEHIGQADVPIRMGEYTDPIEGEPLPDPMTRHRLSSGDRATYLVVFEHDANRLESPEVNVSMHTSLGERRGSTGAIWIDE